MDTIVINNTKLKNMQLVSNTSSKVYTKGDKMYKILKGSKSSLGIAKKKIELVASLNLEDMEKPLTLIYSKDRFRGYVSRKIEGPTVDTFLDSLSLKQLYNLELLTLIYESITKVIIKGNKQGIVFPDLGTLDNFIITKAGCKYIDLMGLQVEKYGSKEYSSLLGNYGDLDKILNNRKYLIDKRLFSIELDKLSLIYLYFDLVFNISLANKKELGKERVISKLFREINLKDYDLMHKVWLLNQRDKPNEYILEDIKRIRDNYTLVNKGAKRVLQRK